MIKTFFFFVWKCGLFERIIVIREMPFFQRKRDAALILSARNVRQLSRQLSRVRPRDYVIPSSTTCPLFFTSNSISEPKWTGTNRSRTGVVWNKKNSDITRMYVHTLAHVFPAVCRSSPLSNGWMNARWLRKFHRKYKLTDLLLVGTLVTNLLASSASNFAFADISK